MGAITLKNCLEIDGPKTEILSTKPLTMNFKIAHSFHKFNSLVIKMGSGERIKSVFENENLNWVSGHQENFEKSMDRLRVSEKLFTFRNEMTTDIK